MKYLVSMVSDESSTETPTPEEMQEMGAKIMALMGELQESGVLADPGGRLAPSASARTLRYGAEGELVVTDGPFAESKEQIVGYMVLECEDIDEALGWVRRMPLRRGNKLEVRPIADEPRP